MSGAEDLNTVNLKKLGLENVVVLKRHTHGPTGKKSDKDRLTKGAIRRLARRSGIKLMSGSIVETTRSLTETFLKRLVRDSMIFMEHRKRVTVQPNDVVRACKFQGRPMYGFGG